MKNANDLLNDGTRTRSIFSDEFDIFYKYVLDIEEERMGMKTELRKSLLWEDE